MGPSASRTTARPYARRGDAGMKGFSARNLATHSSSQPLNWSNQACGETNLAIARHLPLEHQEGDASYDKAGEERVDKASRVDEAEADYRVPVLPQMLQSRNPNLPKVGAGDSGYSQGSGKQGLPPASSSAGL